MKITSKIFLLAGALVVFSLPLGKYAHAQSVLLSNLKSSDGSQSQVEQSQGDQSLLDQSSLDRSRIDQSPLDPSPVDRTPIDRALIATVEETPVPPSVPMKPSRRVSSILETADVGDVLLTPPVTTSAGSHEDLDALLWLRTSAEYDAMTRQTYNAAIEKLGQALVDVDWNALDSSEQSDSTTNLPPCVIVDVDETVLDNSEFQLELIQSGH